MGEITLKIEEDVLDRLRTLASVTGNSVEEEIERIVERAMATQRVDKAELRRHMAETAAMTPPGFDVDLTRLIREDRDR